MKKRNLDGVYFRVERDWKYDDVCFTDLTDEERRRILEGQSVNWLKSMCLHLANALRSIGDELDLEME